MDAMTKRCGLPLLLGAVALAGCERAPAPHWEAVDARPEPPTDMVQALAGDAERLKEVRRLCRDTPDAIEPTLCLAAAQATRQRFMGEGRAKYTPEPVELPDAGLPEPVEE